MLKVVLSLYENLALLHRYDCCRMDLNVLNMLLWKMLVLLLLNLLRDGRSDGGRVLRSPCCRQIHALLYPVGRLAVVVLAVVQSDVLLETALVVVHLVAERAAEVTEGVVVLGAVARELYLAVKRLPAVLAHVLCLFDVSLHREKRTLTCRICF